MKVLTKIEIQECACIFDIHLAFGLKWNFKCHSIVTNRLGRLAPAKAVFPAKPFIFITLQHTHKHTHTCCKTTQGFCD